MKTANVQTWGRPQQKGTRMVANMGCNISENAEVYSFANYGHAEGLWSFYYRYPRASETGVTDFSYGEGLDGGDGGHAAFGGPYVLNATNIERERKAGFTPRLEAIQQDYNVVVGIKGDKLMGMNIDYDLSASRGYNKIDYTLENSLNPSIPLGVECDHDLGATYDHDDDETLPDGTPNPSPTPREPSLPVPCLGADGTSEITAVRDFDTTDLRQRETNFNLDLSQVLTPSMLLSYGVEYREEEFTQYPGSWDARYGGAVSGMAGTKLADSGTNSQESLRCLRRHGVRYER